MKAAAKSRAAASISRVTVPLRLIMPTVSTVRWTTASRLVSGSTMRTGSVGTTASRGPASVTALFRFFAAAFVPMPSSVVLQEDRATQSRHVGGNLFAGSAGDRACHHPTVPILAAEKRTGSTLSPKSPLSHARPNISYGGVCFPLRTPSLALVTTKPTSVTMVTLVTALILFMFPRHRPAFAVTDHR